MIPFVQSSFLQALGFAIANSLWQVAFTWLLFMVLNTFFRFTTATRYRLAVTAQFTSFAWFIATCWLHSSLPAQEQVPALAGGYTGQLGVWLLKATPLLPYLSITYLLLMGLLTLRWIMGYRQTQMIRTQGLQKMPVEWKLFVKKISSHLYIRKEIRLFLSEHVTTPLTIGFLKPVILVPVASINHLTTAQMEAVLLHELAHIKRYDYLLNMIISVMELVLFFNPFSQLLSKTIRKERENSCDDWVLQFQYNVSEYAEALLRIASLQTAPVFAMAASGRKKELLLRIRRMMGQQENRMGYRKQIIAFSLVTAMLAGIAWLSPSPISSPALNKLHPISRITGSKKIFTAEQASFHTTVALIPIHVPKNSNRKEPIIPIPSITLAPVKAPESVDIASIGIAIKERQKLLPVRKLVLNEVNINMDRFIANINNIDIEKTVTDIFSTVQLNDEDKKEFGKIRKFVLTQRDLELMKKEFSEKQQLRLQNSASTPPIIINVSFSMPEQEDAKQLARIKLAILRQINFILQNRERREELGIRN